MEVGTVHQFHKLPFKQFHHLTDLQPCFQNQQQSQVILFLSDTIPDFFSFKTITDPNIACITLYCKSLKALFFLIFDTLQEEEMLYDVQIWIFTLVDTYLVTSPPGSISGCWLFSAQTSSLASSSSQLLQTSHGGQCCQGLEVSAARDWRSVPPGTGGQWRQGWRSVPPGTGGQCRRGLEVSAIMDWSQCR